MIRYINFFSEFGEETTQFQHYSLNDTYTITTYKTGDFSKPLSQKDVTEDQFIARMAGALGCPAGV